MRTLTAALAIVAATLCAPPLAEASSFEDSYADCSYPPTFDLILLRPLGFTALILGSGIWAVHSVPAVIFTRGRVFDPMKRLVIDPFRFTFQRPLGECAESAREL